MIKSDIIVSLQKFIIETFLFGQDKGLKPEESLLKKGIIDSTGVIELIDFIESAFHIIVEDEEIVPENLDSIDRAAAFVMRKRADL
jgi:acyl carrier protein